MSTESCERCGDHAPAALLRNLALQVDGDSVDEQTLCPDCFADWIARYQDEMAGDMPGTATDEAEESVGNDITIAEEEPRPGVEAGALNQAVDAAQEGAENGAQSNARERTSDIASHPTGDDIREVGGEPPNSPGGDGEVEIDIDGEENDEGLF